MSSGKKFRHNSYYGKPLKTPQEKASQIKERVRAYRERRRSQQKQLRTPKRLFPESDIEPNEVERNSDEPRSELDVTSTLHTMAARMRRQMIQNDDDEYGSVLPKPVQTPEIGKNPGGTRAAAATCPDVTLRVSNPAEESIAEVLDVPRLSYHDWEEDYSLKPRYELDSSSEESSIASSMDMLDASDEEAPPVGIGEKLTASEFRPGQRIGA